MKYLRTFGFSVSNDVFAENSWYFRNALVRANYTNLQQGITATTKYLELFFENLLLGQQHELKNRYLHIDFNNSQSAIQSAKSLVPKCHNFTLGELAVLNAIASNPTITQKELAAITGKSERTVKRCTVTLQEKGILLRENGKRNGKWIVVEEKPME